MPRPKIYTAEEAKIRSREACVRWQKKNHEYYKESHKEAIAKWQAKNPDYYKESHRKTMLKYSRLKYAFQKLRNIDDSIFS